MVGFVQYFLLFLGVKGAKVAARLMALWSGPRFFLVGILLADRINFWPIYVNE
jgi:hypothetical protein